MKHFVLALALIAASSVIAACKVQTGGVVNGSDVAGQQQKEQPADEKK